MSLGAIYVGYSLSVMVITIKHILTIYGFEYFNQDNTRSTISRNMEVLLGPIILVSIMVATYFQSYYNKLLSIRHSMIVSDLIYMIGIMFTQWEYWYSYTIGRLFMGVSCALEI